jgi:hypothetical protein
MTSSLPTAPAALVGDGPRPSGRAVGTLSPVVIDAALLDWLLDADPAPDRWVGVVLHPAEVEPLRRLGQVLGAMIADLGDVPDEVYLAEPRWPSVVDRARLPHQALRAGGDLPTG